MNSRGRDAPPASGGEFLLHLLRNPPSSGAPSSPQPPSQSFSQDPAVAAVGPSIPTFRMPHAAAPYNVQNLAYPQWNHFGPPPPPFSPSNYIHQNPSPNPNLNPDLFNYTPPQFDLHFKRLSLGEDSRNLASPGVNLIFGSLNRDVLSNGGADDLNHQGLIRNFHPEDGRVNRYPLNSVEVNESVNSSVLRGYKQRDNGNSNSISKVVAPPPGFSKNQRSREHGYGYGGGQRSDRLSNQIDSPVIVTPGRKVPSSSASDVTPGRKVPSSSASDITPGRKVPSSSASDIGSPVVVTPGRNVPSSSASDIGSPMIVTPGRNVPSSSASDIGSPVIVTPGRNVPSSSASDIVFSKDQRSREHGYGYGGRQRSDRLNNQLDSPVIITAGRNAPSSSASDIDEFMTEFHGDELRSGLEDQLVDSLRLSGEKTDKKKHHRDKDYRSDKRGQWIMGQRMRHLKRQAACRNDIHSFNVPLLQVYESLIPSDEEKMKQDQLLTLLGKLVKKEWPEARLHLYGSCANSFGFSKSDIDVCIEMGVGNIDKPKVLLKLAEIFESDNLQNVQALTRARVPVVKLMDPATGISCDICINNVLAVINTRLLYDYSKIDARLRQLAFIVKHWAKSRGVNETYHGTLSSYAYVLMCIHFLQQRRPPILPCLQGMPTTYYANVDHIQCAYFDEVEKLQNFGTRNGESIAQLVWAFFHYWAYCHDYADDVISVRTGRTLSKRDKDWTRRVGNDRHLICIEDPFETSHDLGRVVDKFSIKVLREEFERAAQIMQCDPNPCLTLFDPYVPN